MAVPGRHPVVALRWRQRPPDSLACAHPAGTQCSYVAKMLLESHELECWTPWGNDNSDELFCLRVRISGNWIRGWGGPDPKSAFRLLVACSSCLTRWSESGELEIGASAFRFSFPDTPFGAFSAYGIYNARSDNFSSGEWAWLGRGYARSVATFEYGDFLQSQSFV